MTAQTIRLPRPYWSSSREGPVSTPGFSPDENASRVTGRTESPLTTDQNLLCKYKAEWQSKYLNEMHKAENSSVKEKKTSSKSSQKSDKKIVQIHQVLVPNLHQTTSEKIEHGKKALKNTLLMPNLRDGNVIETLLMTAQINTDFENHLVPLTTEPSTSLVRVGTDASESKINSIYVTKTMIPIKMLPKIFKSDSLIILSVTGVRFVMDYGLEMI
ncbi:uncharacterized protein TNCV_3932611 [Trichonephila clavipes]|nr:uncharacterized protein TNCV_3932611 [Trichonephila clavipes]